MRRLPGRRFGVLAISASVCGCALTCVALFGSSNRWRVQFHHGVRLPASARQFSCYGSTAPGVNFLGGVSGATFRMDEADLGGFLRQLDVITGTAGTESGGMTPIHSRSSGTPSPHGELACMSPTGRDHLIVKWDTSNDKRAVNVELRTIWD